MKIAYVITQSDVIGGASIHVLDLASGARAAGYKVTVLVGGNGPFVEKLHERDIPHIALKHLRRPISPRSDILATKELQHHLGLLKPTVVHLHSSKAGVIGRLAASRLSIPAIFTAHGWAFTDGISDTKRYLYRNIEKRMSRYASRIITVSDFDRRQAIAAGIGPEAKIRTIHNGIHDIKVQRTDKAPSTELKIIMVARFDKQKDHETTVRALAELPSLPWRLELIGDGPNFRNVAALAARLGVAERVTMPGVCDSVTVAQRLAHADIFSLTSNWEGLPLSILEAMRAGLPVVASDVGGVAETIDDGSTGLLVPRGDVVRAKKAFERLLKSPNDRTQMGSQGRKKFETNFTFDKMLSATFEEYLRLVN